MTKQEVSIVIVQMHTIALTITEKATISTLSLTGPLTITKYLKTFFPHFHKIIFINIALMEITANAGTRRDRTICQNRSYTDTCITGIKMITYFTFIFTEKTFTTITQVDTPLFPYLLNEFQDSGKLLVC